MTKAPNAPKKLAQDMDRIIVQLPDGVREQLAAMAEANGRSMTQEAVAAIEKHLKSVTTLEKVADQVSAHDLEIAFLKQQMWVADQALEWIFDKTGHPRPTRLYLDAAKPAES